eukprot:2032688-Prymnesium_polylepis.1
MRRPNGHSTEAFDPWDKRATRPPGEGAEEAGVQARDSQVATMAAAMAALGTLAVTGAPTVAMVALAGLARSAVATVALAAASRAKAAVLTAVRTLCRSRPDH